MEQFDRISYLRFMEISLERKKIELIQWLSTLYDNSVIDKLMELRNAERTDWWSELSEVEKESIEKGVKDADEGKLNPHSKARDIYGKWF